MNKKINWPIITDEYPLFIIKNRINWLTFNNNIYNFFNINYIFILIIIIVWIIIWWLSNYYYIAPLKEQYSIYIYYNNVNNYIYKYIFNMYPSILSDKDFWYKYNFIHLYINLLLKAPITLIKDLLKLYIYFDNRPFDSTVSSIFYNLNLIKYPIKYWSNYMNYDYILYYLKYINEIRSWQYFPRFWWYWTDWFYTYNKDAAILNYVSPKQRYFLMFLDFMRPYFYFLGFYAYNKYLTNYDSFYFLNISYEYFMLYGYQLSLMDIGAIIKWLKFNHLNFLKWSLYEYFIMEHMNMYWYTPIFRKDFDYWKYIDSSDISFLPRVSFFFLKNVYLPIYLPVESFQKWFVYNYNRFLIFIPYIFNYNVHFFSVSDSYKLSILMSSYFKMSYIFTIYNDWILVTNSIITKGLFPLKIWLNTYIFNQIDFVYLKKHILLEWYQFKMKKFTGVYGFWYIEGLRQFTIYFLAYIWLFYFLFSTLNYYFYKDFWLYKIIWQNPTYLWNISKVNHHIEKDYMLSVDYLRVERYLDYMHIISNLIPVFYLPLCAYLMTNVLIRLEGFIGFSGYFYNYFGYFFQSNWALWCSYVIFPISLFIVFKFIKFVGFSVYNLFQNLWLFANTNIILYIHFYIYLFSLDTKKDFVSNNIIKSSYSFNIDLLDDLYVKNQSNSPYVLSKSLLRYWGLGNKSYFDNVYKFNYISKNTYDVYNKNNLKFNLNPINALQYVKLTNTAWRFMRTNHFYVYYDFIDLNRLSIDQ